MHSLPPLFVSSPFWFILAKDTGISTKARSGSKTHLGWTGQAAAFTVYGHSRRVLFLQFGAFAHAVPSAGNALPVSPLLPLETPHFLSGLASVSELLMILMHARRSLLLLLRSQPRGRPAASHPTQHDCTVSGCPPVPLWGRQPPDPAHRQCPPGKRFILIFK